MKVLISFEDRIRPDSTGVYFKRAFQKLGHDVKHVLPPDIDTVIDGHDLYVKIDDGLIDARWNRNIHPSAYYAIDVHLDVDWRLKLVEESDFDYVFVAQKQGLNLPWKCKNVFWVPLGCDPEIHNVGQKEKNYDVCFIGNFHSQYASKRIELVDFLFKNFTNFYYGSRFFNEMTEKYAESKIVFNCSLNQDINMRFFEALCSGSCLVTDYIPEIKEIGLIDHVHYFSYENKEELVGLVSNLLKNKNVREGVAGEGKKEILKNHTYENRVKEMLKLMEEKELCLQR